MCRGGSHGEEDIGDMSLGEVIRTAFYSVAMVVGVALGIIALLLIGGVLP